MTNLHLITPGTLPSCPLCGRHDLRIIGAPVSRQQVQCRYCGLRAPWGVNRDRAMDQWQHMVRNMAPFRWFKKEN